MNGVALRRCWLGLAGLIGMAILGPSQAWEKPPLKVNTVFKFQVEVKVGPDIKKPTAPWYAYFPADPRMSPSLQSSPYPPWPQQFPPRTPPTDAHELKKLSADYAGGPMQMTYWPGYAVHGSQEPVGYIPTSVPSYWYPKR